jgi:hypothetical protein
LQPLFTRIFLSFWAAIVLIGAGAVALTAINFARGSAQPGAVTREAESVLRRDGVDGLRVWLAERNRSDRRQRTLIIDAEGRDILGQTLPSFGGPGPPPAERRFRRAKAARGHRTISAHAAPVLKRRTIAVRPRNSLPRRARQRTPAGHRHSTAPPAQGRQWAPSGRGFVGRRGRSFAAVTARSIV